VVFLKPSDARKAVELEIDVETVGVGDFRAIY
jgi:hypothetical protein